jgi:hypothetical protein
MIGIHHLFGRDILKQQAEEQIDTEDEQYPVNYLQYS